MTLNYLMVMLELWRMRSIPSLPLLSGSLYPKVVAPDWVLSMVQIEPFGHVTVCKQMTGV